MSRLGDDGGNGRLEAAVDAFERALKVLDLLVLVVAFALQLVDLRPVRYVSLERIRSEESAHLELELSNLRDQVLPSPIPLGALPLSLPLLGPAPLRRRREPRNLLLQLEDLVLFLHELLDQSREVLSGGVGSAQAERGRWGGSPRCCPT